MSRCWQELKCLMDTKAGNQKAASRHSLADWLHYSHGWFEQMWRKGCSIRLEDEMLCCTMYLDKDCFFTLKNKLHLPAFFVFCPFSLSFFQEKKSDTVYVFVTCRFYIYFFCIQVHGGCFFVAIVKLWNMNKGVQYDMSCYMIFAMLPRDIPRVCMFTLYSSCMYAFSPFLFVALHVLD